MRLLYKLQADKVKRTKFYQQNPPPYAILSHTWGNPKDEVGFNNISKSAQKPGFQKLTFCSQWAREDGLEYFWVDTCCIYRTDEQQLFNAFQSKFQWYQNAAQCYVYLVDVPDHNDTHAWNALFRQARWFKRGWTLQELLAPRSVKFYSQNGRYLGDKVSLEQQIHDATGIPINALRGTSLSSFSIQERFSWFEKRQTTFPEDAALCLQGLFDVRLPNMGSLRKHEVRHLRALIEKREDELDLESQKANLRDVETDESKRVKLDQDTSTEGIYSGQREQLLRSMHLEGIVNCHDKTKPALAGTCRWVLDNKQYLDWLHHSNHTTLWIRGHCGAGKSTLLQFLLQNFKAQHQDYVVASYHSTFGHDDPQGSVRHMYQSLLAQILVENEMPQSFWDGAKEHQSSASSGITGVKDLIIKAIKSLDRSLIAAIDISNEMQIREVTRFLEQFGDNTSKLRVLLVSRCYDGLTIPSAVLLNLEDQQGHQQDLNAYLAANLLIGTGSDVQLIQEELCQRYTGKFLWLVVVVQILNRTWQENQNVVDKLGGIPDLLDELYGELLGQNDAVTDEMRLCFIWMLFSRTPLRRDELYFAILSGTDPNALHAWDMDDVPVETIDQFILSSSKGLARVDESNEVHFIHESVRQFLLDENGLNQMFGSDEVPHDTLKTCCLNYLKSKMFDTAFLVKPLPYHTRSLDGIVLLENAQRAYPFLKHAVDNILAYADAAQAQGSDQEIFLEGFDIGKWAHFHDLLEQRETRRYQQYNPTLLYIASAANHSHLVRLLACKSGQAQTSGAGRFDNPIYAAIANDCKESFNELTGPDSQWHPSITAYFANHPSPQPFIWEHSSSELACRFVSLYRLPVTDLPDLCGGLMSATEHGHEKFLRTFLAKHWTEQWEPKFLFEHLQAAINVNNDKILTMLLTAGLPPGSWGQSLGETLNRAIMSKETRMFQKLVHWCRDAKAQSALDYALCNIAGMVCPDEMEILIAAGANVNATDIAYGTPLYAAAPVAGNERAIQMLLDAGANINTYGVNNTTPLQHATRMGNLAGVQLLIQAGADVNEAELPWCTPLSSALATSNLHIFHLLLAHGADPNSPAQNTSSSPLILAAGQGDTQAVRALLDAGANVNFRTQDGTTALGAAVRWLRSDIIEMLRARGAQ